MISARAVYGGTYNHGSTAVGVAADPRLARVWRVNPTAPALKLTIPLASKFQPGGPHLVILNEGGDDMTIQNSSLQTLGTALAGKATKLYVVEGASANSWAMTSHDYTAGTLASAPAGPTTFNIAIASGVLDYNLRDEVDALGYDGSSAATVTVTIGSGVHVGASDPTVAAFRTGSFPGGSTISITNNGFIEGAGGKGGFGAFKSFDLPAFNLSAEAGEAGGTALLIEVASTLDNSAGTIRGGGGGGGGAEISDPAGGGDAHGGGGGGGGQGRLGGAGGQTLRGSDNCLIAPDDYAEPGDANGPGAGGTGVDFVSTVCINSNTGGSGGAWGAAGSAGGGTGAAGGAAGNAIDGYSLITFAGTPGTITGGVVN